jgi:type III restriction enzyme
MYEPDFVVETKTAKLICEPKMAKDINTDEVRDKARAAVKWCEDATDHEKQVGGKPWAYLLIPHDAVDEAKTIQGLAAAFTLKSPEAAVRA